MENKQIIDISTSTILRFILIILGIFFLYLIRDILLMLFVAVVIAAAIDGPVDWLERHKVRRFFGTAILYIFLFLLVAFFLYLVLPPLAGQLKILANNLPDLLEKLGAGFSIVGYKVKGLDFQVILQNLSGQLAGATTNVFGTAVNIFGGIFNFVVILVISIYLVAQDKSLKEFLAGLVPEKHQAYTANLVERIKDKLGAWLRGQLIVMFILGLLSFIGLTILNVKYALTISLLAALFEIVPYVGPILSGAAGMMIALVQSPILALLVLALFVVIHQLEGNIIAPQVMRRAVGLNPLTVIIALIIGGKVAGILGILISVPLATIISLILKDFFSAKET